MFRLQAVRSLFVLTLAVLLAWLMGLGIANMFRDVALPVLPEIAFTGAVPQADNSVVLARVDLFGKPEKLKAVEVVKIESEVLAVSRLNLTLIGLVGLGNKGVALIDKSGKVMVVTLGEEFLPGVSLLKIVSSFEVLISNQGKRERLLLRGKANALLGTKKELALQGGSPASNLPGQELSAVERKRLDTIGVQLRKSPMAIANFIRFQPVSQAGVWQGVRISPKADKELFVAMGFKDGDILTEVNGNSVTSIAENPALWQEFLVSSQFDLIVKRHGVLHNISVNFN